MSFTNINDPEGVTALLEKLKSSAAWQQLSAVKPTNQNIEVSAPTGLTSIPQEVSTSTDVDAIGSPTDSTTKVTSATGSTVASLLSQLQPFSHAPATSSLSDSCYDYSDVHDLLPKATSARSSSSAGRLEIYPDRTKLTFRQSLPLLSELGDIPSFVTTVKKMKADQDALERRLWADREAIYAKYQGKLKVAETKAQMLGIVVSQHEQNMITDALKKDIFEFDHELALLAWDALVSRQQQELAQLEVPTMFVTGDVGDRERQQQVMRVLETISQFQN